MHSVNVERAYIEAIWSRCSRFLLFARFLFRIWWLLLFEERDENDGDWVSELCTMLQLRGSNRHHTEYAATRQSLWCLMPSDFVDRDYSEELSVIRVTSPEAPTRNVESSHGEAFIFKHFAKSQSFRG